MRKAQIVGVGDTPVGNLELTSPMQLHSDAAWAALDDAGLRKEDIDGVITAYSIVEPHLMLSSVFCEYFGIHPKVATAIQMGGASGCGMIMQAMALVESGQCENVLVVTGDNRLSGMSRDQAVESLSRIGHPQYETPYGPIIPGFYALVANRYMHEYGVTSEQLAHIAVTMRKHAALHPNSHKKTSITVQDVLESKMIADPLHLYDCCPVSDGGGAVIVSSKNVAKNLAKEAISILGTGQAHTHEHIIQAGTLTEFGCKDSAEQALRQAGISIKDIDVAEIYDSFTITLLIQLESIGFFEKGESGLEIAKGAIGLEGRIPVNTHGGLLSYGHSGAAGGLWHVIEAVRQLRNEANKRQIEGAELAFVHGDGGVLSAHASLVLGKE